MTTPPTPPVDVVAAATISTTTMTSMPTIIDVTTGKQSTPPPPFRRHGLGAGPSSVVSCPSASVSPSNAITSYGIICFRTRPGSATPEYVMVQRKDSMSYVEFLRGKYRIADRTYLCRLLSNMTRVERERLVRCSFHDMWQAFWLVDNPRNYEKDYNNSLALFERLRNGFNMQLRATTSGAPAAVVHVSLSTLLADTAAGRLPEVEDGPEWGFPKGRRNVDESDLGCAIREFREETGIDVNRHVTVYATVRPFEETFVGSNRVLYRHVYYLAQLSRMASDAGMYDTPAHDAHALTTSQQREIGAIRWCDQDAVHRRIRSENLARLEVFCRVNAWVVAMGVPPSLEAHQPTNTNT